MKGRAESEDVLRECASGRISDYYQVTKGWANHQGKCACKALLVRNCGLHPLIHTLLKFGLPQDVEKKKSGAKNSAFSKLAPKYCSGASRAKV